MTLTAYELAVLRMAGEGNTVPSTAAVTRRSEFSVMEARRRARRKLRARNTTHAYALAWRQGMLP